MAPTTFNHLLAELACFYSQTIALVTYLCVEALVNILSKCPFISDFSPQFMKWQ